MPDAAAPPLRSFLFAPANHPRRVEKVFGLGADAFILDLEDAVPLAEKVATRDALPSILEAAATQSQRYVRVNGVDTEFCEADLGVTVGPWLDGIVVPKVESVEGLLQFETWLAAAETAAGITAGSLDLIAIIETARGVEYAGEIAEASQRVSRLALGGGDYTLDLDYVWSELEEVLAYPRARLAHASRLGDLLPPIDTVVLQVKDDQRFVASAERGKMFGFGGKLCIHPDQVALTHEVFTPSTDEIAHAAAVVAAFEVAEAAGRSAIQLDGYFIDYPVVAKSQRILAQANRLGLKP